MKRKNSATDEVDIDEPKIEKVYPKFRNLYSEKNIKIYATTQATNFFPN